MTSREGDLVLLFLHMLLLSLFLLLFIVFLRELQMENTPFQLLQLSMLLQENPQLTSTSMCEYWTIFFPPAIIFILFMHIYKKELSILLRMSVPYFCTAADYVLCPHNQNHAKSLFSHLGLSRGLCNLSCCVMYLCHWITSAPSPFFVFWKMRSGGQNQINILVRYHTIELPKYKSLFNQDILNWSSRTKTIQMWSLLLLVSVTEG